MTTTCVSNASFTAWSGSRIGSHQIVGRAAGADGRQVRADVPAGPADGVALQARQVGPPEDELARGRRRLRRARRRRIRLDFRFGRDGLVLHRQPRRLAERRRQRRVAAADGVHAPQRRRRRLGAGSLTSIDRLGQRVRAALPVEERRHQAGPGRRRASCRPCRRSCRTAPPRRPAAAASRVDARQRRGGPVPHRQADAPGPASVVDRLAARPRRTPPERRAPPPGPAAAPCRNFAKFAQRCRPVPAPATARRAGSRRGGRRRAAPRRTALVQPRQVAGRLELAIGRGVGEAVERRQPRGRPP